MNPDYGAAAGIGVGFIIFGIVLYIAILALALWVSYLLMRTAVKNGMILAMRETGAQFPPAGYRPPAPPQFPTPQQPGPPAR